MKKMLVLLAALVTVAGTATAQQVRFAAADPVSITIGTAEHSSAIPAPRRRVLRMDRRLTYAAVRADTSR